MPLVDEVGQDLRYAARVLRRSPGFTATAIATLALCLGANLAVFAVVNAVLLRPLPFPASDRLVRVYNTYPKAGVPDDGASFTNYYERRGAIAAFSGVSLYREGTALVGEPGSTEREPVMRVTSDFFATLGAGPLLGRAFTEDEMNVEAGRVAILTDGYWRQRFNGDPGVVGRTIRVDGTPRLVVGILPPSFRFLSSRARLFFPLVTSPDNRGPMQRHSGSSSQMVARLRPDSAIERAQAEVDAHNASLEAGSPTAKMIADAGFRSLVMPLHGEHVAAVRPVLLFVQAGAVCLLLIGGVNLVNLLLIRATTRSRELVVRQAIGGSHARITRQVVVETMLLALVGAAFGLAAGAIGIRLLATLGTSLLPLGAQIGFDTSVASAGVLAALVLGAAMALPIAWYSLRSPAAAALALDSRGATAGPGVRRLRHAFLVAQVALAFALLSAAGVLGLSLERVTAISPGFNSARVLSGQISLPVRTYPDTPARRQFVDRLMQALERQPGISAAGLVTNVPFSGRDIKSAITVEGWRPAPGDSVRGHYGYGVGGRYFAAMGMPLVEGRFLEPGDIQRGDRLVVVDEDFAGRYWPGGSALGHRLFAGPRAGSDAEAYTIVGVVGSQKQAGLTDTASTGAVFFPYADRFDTELFLVARTLLAPESLASSMRQAVRDVDADLSVSDLRSMDTRIADSLVARRSPAVLAGIFSALALLLTAIGTYGVISYAVATRRREIALRIALGATPGRMGREFVALSLRLVALGSAAGLAGAWLASGALRTLLYSVPPMHAPTLAVSAATLCALSLAACVLPAVRAARVSPAEALRD
ncbi:MAG TPA: ABC transporter permease [Vicinamibacterales bacterium]|nr:ABC transporter permease [Vicinamibacterales bacterium]